jgi:hypothetical protein
MSMRVFFLGVGVMILADGSVVAQFRRGDQQAGKYGWLASLEDGKAQARKNGKPLVVVVRCVP